jgi:hypothetical protein
MSDKYILDSAGNPEPAPSLMAWANWFDGNRDKRRVGDDTVGDVRVSTVFLGLDHSFGGGPPLLYETMVFGGPLDGEQERYSTRAEAEAGHATMLARVTEHSPDTP